MSQENSRSFAYDRGLALELFSTMVRIRAFEEVAYSLYMAGDLPGFMHSSIGQEAISVGASKALRGSDVMTTTHRGHGDVLAKGISVEVAMAELFAKAAGACHGKGGSMHIADFKQGILGANGIVAAGIPIAAGAALAAKYRGTDGVALAFFGDGAVSAGPTHETMNIAALLKLPLIFVRQNNLYAQTTPISDFQGIPDVVRWAASYGIASSKVDGNDVLSVYDATKRAVANARQGKGPSFLECETYRWHGHNVGDAASWRPQAEVEQWKSKDPIGRFRNVLVENRVVGGDDLGRLEREERDIVTAAANAARAAADPDPGQALSDVYGDLVLGSAATSSHRR